MIDFMIIGAQKAATSSLQEALRAHPDVFMPEGESAFFEDPDYAERPWERFAATAPAGARRGIKRPDYLCTDQSIERIAKETPNARFIVVLREPLSRAISGYSYMVRHGHVPALPLNEGLAKCVAAYESEARTRAAEVVRYGLYGAYLEKWMKHFPRERFLALAQTMVATQPGEALALCEDHIDVPHRGDAGLEVAGEEVGRANVGLYDPGLLRIARVGSQLKTRPIEGTNRRQPSALPLRALGHLFTGSAEAAARMLGQRKEELEPAMRERLQAIYNADLPRLRACVPAEAIYWAKEAAEG